jgi:hypothetical protein
MATPVRDAVQTGLLKVRSLLAEARVRRLGAAELAEHDPDAALLNVNTRSELESL